MGCVLDQPGVYLIHVAGQIDAYRLAQFGTLQGLYVAGASGCDNSITVLVGTLPDQAALIGVLNQLYNMRFPLLLVEYLRPVRASQPERQAEDFEEKPARTSL